MQLDRIRDAGLHGGHTVSPISSELIKTNLQDGTWVDRMSTPQPLATLTEAIHLQGNQEKIKIKIYLLATGWQPSGFREYYDRASKDPSWIARTIDSGHEVILNHPKEVTNFLKEAAVLAHFE
jgi:hypothetical protein